MTDERANSDYRPTLRTGWGWMMASGIAFVIIGFLAAMNPLATGIATGIVVAVALMVGGIIAIAAGLANIREKGSSIYILLGLLALLLGAVTSVFPFSGALSLVWAIGAWLLAGGILELVAALRAVRGRTSLILLGLLNVVLGGLLLFMNPGSALLFLAVIVGVSFVFRGIGSILFALHLRELSRL